MQDYDKFRIVCENIISNIFESDEDPNDGIYSTKEKREAVVRAIDYKCHLCVYRIDILDKVIGELQHTVGFEDLVNVVEQKIKSYKKEITDIINSSRENNIIDDAEFDSLVDQYSDFYVHEEHGDKFRHAYRYNNRLGYYSKPQEPRKGFYREPR